MEQVGQMGQLGQLGNGFSPEGKKIEGQPFGRPGVGILFSSLVRMPVYFLMLGISRP